MLTASPRKKSKSLNVYVLPFTLFSRPTSFNFAVLRTYMYTYCLDLLLFFAPQSISYPFAAAAAAATDKEGNKDE